MKSWKTTLVGIIGALASWGAEVLKSGNVTDWKQLIIPAVILVLGIVSKDFDTTGGTVDNGMTVTK